MPSRDEDMLQVETGHTEECYMFMYIYIYIYIRYKHIHVIHILQSPDFFSSHFLYLHVESVRGTTRMGQLGASGGGCELPELVTAQESP